MNFIKEVLLIIKGGDEAKIHKFQKRAISNYNQSIAACNYNVDTLESKLEDAKDIGKAALVTIDCTKLTDTDTMDAYIVDFSKLQIKSAKNIEEIKESITAEKAKIEQFETLITAISSKD